MCALCERELARSAYSAGLQTSGHVSAVTPVLINETRPNCLRPGSAAGSAAWCYLGWHQLGSRLTVLGLQAANALWTPAQHLHIAGRCCGRRTGMVWRLVKAEPHVTCRQAANTRPESAAGCKYQHAQH